MTRKPAPPPPGAWPILMRAEMAAAYLNEVSVEAFRRKVGKVYPKPRTISGRGQVWLKRDLDRVVDQVAAARSEDAVHLL